MTDFIKDLKNRAGITEERVDTMPGGSPTTKDDLNPAYAFRTIHTKLLAQFANREYDPVHYVKLEMIARGLDQNGKWIGHEAAAKLWR